MERPAPSPNKSSISISSSIMSGILNLMLFAAFAWGGGKRVDDYRCHRHSAESGSKLG